MAAAREPWWIIGSAAVALHGGDPGGIADVDVITSRRDLEALYRRLPLTNTPDTSKSMFVSDLFGRWSEPALEVEFMTGLKLRIGDRWEPVQPQTRVAVKSDGTIVYVPEKAELIAILQRFGREKDLRRAETLR